MPFGFTRQSEIDTKRYEELKASVSAYIAEDDNVDKLTSDLRRVITDLKAEAQANVDKLAGVEGQL